VFQQTIIEASSRDHIVRKHVTKTYKNLLPAKYERKHDDQLSTICLKKTFIKITDNVASSPSPIP